MIIWQGTVSIVNQPLVWKFNPQRINTRNHLKFCNIKIHSKSPQANGLNERWRTFFGLPMRNEVDRKLLIGFKWRGKWSIHCSHIINNDHIYRSLCHFSHVVRKSFPVQVVPLLYHFTISPFNKSGNSSIHGSVTLTAL